MGVILGSGVVPIALCVTWKKANKWGCIGGSVAGFAAGIIAWLVTTATLNDNVITVTTSGGDFEMLAGNLASIGVGGIIATVTSLIWPEDYDWESTRNINKIHAHTGHAPVIEDNKSAVDDMEKREKSSMTKVTSSVVADSQNEYDEDDELDTATLKKAFNFAAWSSIILFVVMILIIPLPLFFSHHVYGTAGFTAWVAIGIAWTFFSTFAVVLYPLWESRAALSQISKGIVKDIFTRGGGKYIAPQTTTPAA